MRIKVMSDLHFELHRDHGNSFLEHDYTDRTDVLVIPGDLSDYALLEASIGKVCTVYKHALVLFVPGNHEFYGSSIPRTLSTLSALSGKYENFTCLYNGRLVYNGVKFFGTTLWFRHVDDIEWLYPRMNDFYQIEKFDRQVYSQNHAAMDFLWHADMHEGIVITHMAPSKKSIHPKFANNPLNPFFVCEVDNIILSKQPRFWLHGHMHKSADYNIGGTRVICNPMGYVLRDQNLDFNYELLLEV